jgi:hypothetical protein
MTRYSVCSVRGRRREPPLAEVLADPIIRALMTADHVSEKEIAAVARSTVFAAARWRRTRVDDRASC